MTIKLAIRTLALFLFLLSAVAQAADSLPASAFHPPRTEAEKELDRILALDRKSSDLYNFLMQRKWHKESNAAQFSHLFTQDLLRAWVEHDRRLAKKYCGEDFNAANGMCGIDYSPVSCNQEINETYLYRTVSFSDKEAVVTYKWPDLPAQHSLYRFVNDHGTWKLDGVKCPKDEDDDRDFNYTRPLLQP